MKIVMGSDHAGVELKGLLVEFLIAKGYDVQDLGPFSKDSVDYPDYAVSVCNVVSAGQADFGVLICGTGLGMSITANKIKGIRAVSVSETFSAEMARAHNNANVLTFGARVVGSGVAEQILITFLETSFEAGRHQRRVDKINVLDGSRKNS